MAKETGRWNRILFVFLLTAGFLGLCLPNLLHFTEGAGIATTVWILAFLFLMEKYSSRREIFLTGGVFLLGYYLRFFNAMGTQWLFSMLYLFVGAVLFAIFYAYSRLLRRWNRGICTIVFPLLWMAAYLLATLARCPTLLRVDSMLSDMEVLLQAESLIGSSGLSFLVLWSSALVAHAVCSRKFPPAAVGISLYLAALLVGIVYLFPNVTETEHVRVALSTGPYVGDFINCISLSEEQYLESMRSCVAEASAQGAEILVLSEESYELDDTAEERFLRECSQAARENGIHMLVGLDLRDTDGSENGLSVNKVVWIDQSGELLGSYCKNKTIPLVEAGYIRGNDDIPSHVITAGGQELKVSYVICYDSNFPRYISRIDDDTDILFLPSWDWDAIDEQHAALCRTIAVENRVSIIKPTYDGYHLGVRADGTIIGMVLTAETGFEKVLVMDVPLRGDRGLVRENPEKAPDIRSIIAVEILSILFGLVLLYGNMFEYREDTPRNRMYSRATALCILGLATDAVSWVCDGCQRLGPVLMVSTTLSLIITFLLNGAFVLYIMEYIREKEAVSMKAARIYMILAVIASLGIVIMTGTGMLFSFEDGVYQEGPLYTDYIIVNLICTLFCFAISLANMKRLSVHDRVATMSLLLIPFLAGCINIKVESFSYAYPASMLSLSILYTMIQSERAGRLKEESSASSYAAHHDALTGLSNRLAYEERLKEISLSDGMTGVVFTDVNGLKLTNDRFGHEAGDSLLRRYAERLCSCFRKEDVFRISGDEFTVLLENIDKMALNARMERFRKVLDENGVPMASAGMAFGEGKNIVELIRNAESEMYRSKQELYRIHPEFSRK